ncbi:MAG: tetratricopeptide repeat protein [Marinicaulis sp.]|nr:tetratricopeptide repeat protein [Marinicaulis sp.]
MSKTGKCIGIAAFIFFGTAPAVLAAPGGGSSGAPVTQPKQNIDPAKSYQEGVEALEAGDYKKAERKFGEVLRVMRDMPEANYYMGLAKVGREKHKASVKYFKRAVKERPNFVEAREQLALSYIVLEKTEEAAEQQAALEELKVSCATAECDTNFIKRLDDALSRIALAMGEGIETDDVSAAPIDKDIFAARTDGESRYGAAVRLINQSRYDEAIEALYLAQAAIGPHPDVLNYLGFCHRKLGDFDKARGFYALALEIDSQHLGANEYLGELYVETGELDRAKRQLVKLDALCAFGCAEREDLARLIEIKESVRRAER